MVLDYHNLNLYDNDNKNIHIVGECHSNIEYENLICSIIEKIDPDGIAVESSTYISLNSGGIEQAKKYSSSLDIPIAVVDQREEWMKRKLGKNKNDIISEANSFQKYMKQIGDVTPRIITDARNVIRDKFGREEFKILYTEREKYMASRVKAFQEYVQGDIVLVCGAFHVFAISELIEVVNPIISENRILDSEDNSIFLQWY